MIRRLIAVGLTVCVGVALPDHASAHGGGGSDASNYRSDVLDPGDNRLRWRVFGGDALIELSNNTGVEVIVEGYEHEPYLRFTPNDGVYENIHSPATYLNNDRYARVELPAQADPTRTPYWRKRTSGTSSTWHDHRVHWMASVPPAVVEADPGAAQLISRWSIPLHVGDRNPQQVAATGDLRWISSVTWWPPVLILAVGLAAIVAIASGLTRPSQIRWTAISRPAAILLAAVLAANIVRTIDDIAAIPATLREQLTVAAIAAVAVTFIGALTTRGWRGDLRGLAALASGGIATMLLFGAESSIQLSAPNSPPPCPTGSDDGPSPPASPSSHPPSSRSSSQQPTATSSNEQATSRQAPTDQAQRSANTVTRSGTRRLDGARTSCRAGARST